jgi:hypothetical protein
MKQTIWVSFDLGIRGDYEGMYGFLDTHQAKECGDGVAVLQYDFEGDLAGKLKEDLAQSVKLDKRSRIYVVFPGENGKYKGRFIVGGRKPPPWAGYGSVAIDEEDRSE